MPQEALFAQADVQYIILINYTILRFMNIFYLRLIVQIDFRNLRY